VEASRPEPILLEGLSRFLIGHERCGAGFDVAHPSGVGSGRVSITCRGCGESHEYVTATLEVEREVQIERVTAPAAPGSAPGVPADSATAIDAGQAAPPPAAGAGAGPFWRRHGVTIALLALAAAALAFAGYRLATGDEDEPVAATPPASNAAEQPGSPAPANPPAEEPNPPPPPAPPAEPASGSGPATVLVRTSRFTLRIPASWNRGQAQGGLLLSRPGGGVSLAVFFERDRSMSRAEMAAAAADFLARRNPGARITGPRRVTVGGAAGFEVVASGAGPKEAAIGILDGPYRYLLLRREAPGASAAARRQLAAAQDSFRPR
jgi:hypothetical protein